MVKKDLEMKKNFIKKSERKLMASEKSKNSNFAQEIRNN
jgi:hypothetical protein